MARARVVVLGAGFGGLACARHLAGEAVDVTIVDRHNYHTFQPMLYEVATAGLAPGDIAYPVRTIFGKDPNVTFRRGTATGIDRDGRLVHLADGVDLPYDFLVVATGATAAFFGVPGAADYSFPLYTLADARRLRDHVLALLDEADAAADLSSGGAPAGTITFVVVGGGATGVEISGALMELLDVSLRRDGMRIDPSEMQVVLLDSGNRLLPAFRAVAGEYALGTLAGRRVEVRLETAVAEVRADSVRLADGHVIPTRTVVWAGGVSVTGTVADQLGVPTSKGGRVVVHSDLTVPGWPGVYAIGDAAAVPRGPSQVSATKGMMAGAAPDECPQLAQVAIQSGHHAARQILRRSTDDAEPFRYIDKGIMATIGRRAAVAQLPRVPVIRGTLGWLAWFGLHLLYLIGFRNRVTVLVNWTWRYLQWASGPRITGDDAP